MDESTSDADPRRSLAQLTFSDLIDDNERLRLENEHLIEAEQVKHELLCVALARIVSLTERLTRLTAMRRERR